MPTKELIELLTSDARRVAASQDFRALAGKRVLITGAGGLIGLNFLASLERVAEEVPGIAIFPVIHSEPPPFLAPLLGHRAVRPYRGDLTDENFLRTLPEADLVIHAAGSGEPARFMQDPVACLRINSFTTFELLKKLGGKGTFLFLSSTDVYNGLASPRYSEDQIGTTNTDHPRACYIEGKRSGETLCNLYRERGVNAVSVRLSVTYGPGTRQGDQRALPAFVQKGLAGRIDLLDQGDAERTFCYVSDAVELMWHAALRGVRNCYNVGGVSEIKIRDLAQLVGRLLNAPVSVPAAGGGVSGAPAATRLDLGRILSECGKKDFVGLEEGLARTIAWHRNLQDAV
ncbi:MAG: NAD-dependent epimerase/dehydratase family protein [Elusimicrobiales bacterium]|nr:NAD-dependent epimerase/dehydratase family protein [Elusimicrobiales bacterium]